MSLSSLAPETTARLAECLTRSLRELGRLEARARQMRASKSWVTRGLLVFSPSALDQLCGLIREGSVAIEHRLAEQNAGEIAEETFGPPAVGPRAAAFYDPEALFIAYRACGRALGASLAEARKISDANTAGMLSSLVCRLEKQLWLLDPPVHRENQGVPTITRLVA